jgi:hypothetical protein
VTGGPRPWCATPLRLGLLLLGAATIAGLPGCTSDGTKRRDLTTAAPSIPPPTQLNQLQARITAALAELGIAAHPAELSLESAQMSAVFGDGSELFVDAIPAASERSETIVRAERQIAGKVVRTVQHTSGTRPREQFQCDGSNYETHGAIPPGFASFDVFLSRFITALACG